ncbi:hypothetical protein CGMCC3_g2077 [Colletotrichum fructicola]|nr:uncharacterized protein CGMCC3_g2077 [Colletotrichum fructicola]KAE9581980.1 hypothetical protein CGMCC3_g2077 [Colletotrichum fructicola]
MHQLQIPVESNASCPSTAAQGVTFRLSRAHDLQSRPWRSLPARHIMLRVVYV